MATLPAASVSIDDEAGALAGGTGYVAVLACVATNADSTPRVFTRAKNLLAQHGYAPGVDYSALHVEATKKPVLFVGMPIATAGVLGSVDSTGVTGTCNISVSAGSDGYLEAVDAELTVVTGGTVGTDQITFELSLDGGRTVKLIRLGTATSYTIPYVGVVLSFQSGGTLVAEDAFTFRTTAPMWDSAGLQAAREALAAQTKLVRSLVVIGDIPNATFAGYVTTQVNAYETANERFTYARVNVKDRLPLASKSKVKKRMVGSPELTFAEVGATGDTITRATGSWVTDGFAVNDLVTVAGTSSNNFTDAKVTGVTATVLTLDTQDLVAETTSAATVVGSEAITFAEVGATGDTITRSTGSWVADGFAAGDTVVITGTASNNVTAVIDTVTATVMTLTDTDLAAEVIAGWRVTVTKSLTVSAWVSATDAAFASVDGQKRIDLGIGRLRKLSPITNWEFRRPVMWAASIREYQHALHIPCWRKEDGPLDGWSMVDDDGTTVVEFDERVDGGALAGRFTCARTWANGPNGAFISLSMTRATEGSLLSRTHNMSVANLACTVTHAATEMAIGQSLVLNEDGTATSESLGVIQEKVNAELSKALLEGGREGPRASSAVWTPSSDDDLSVVPATLTGVLDLRLNGTLEQIETTVRVS